jgi:hypothetical protein
MEGFSSQQTTVNNCLPCIHHFPCSKGGRNEKLKIYPIYSRRQKWFENYSKLSLAHAQCGKHKHIRTLSRNVNKVYTSEFLRDQIKHTLLLHRNSLLFNFIWMKVA